MAYQAHEVGVGEVSGYRNRTLQRVDATAKGLIAEVVGYGARYLPINGVIDGVIWFRGQVYLVDWKSAKTPLTDAQSKLVTEGWPIWFLRDSAALRELLFGRTA